VRAEVYLAFDFGSKRIGVAVGDAVTRGARGLGAVPPDWEKIRGLLKEWTPAACVVGLPLGRDDEEQPITRQARAFARELQQHFNGPVHLCDERYSSRSALGDLRDARADGRMKRRVKSGDKDSVAAKVILEQWMNEQQGIRN
jgi:putative holliday junction resolvase